MSVPDPISCTLFIVSAFVLAGLVQIAWLRSHVSGTLAVPLDGGLQFRGRPIFGVNKTSKGFIVMVPAVGGAFLLLGMAGGTGIPHPWPLSPGAYFLLGCWAGLGHMLAELPNSFLKRQCDIPPGTLPTQPVARVVCFLVDQTDSVVGALLALAFFVPVPLATWIVLLLAGPVIHWFFNVALLLLGVKVRAA
jgi:hypothetical protein